MALVHKAEALIQELTGNEAIFNKTREAGIVGGHNPIQRGVTAGRPGEAGSRARYPLLLNREESGHHTMVILQESYPGKSMKTVKKTLTHVFSKNELRNEVYASIQARGDHPNIVNVLAWDPSTSAIVTADLGRYTVRKWVVHCRPKAKQIYHVAYQMLDMILWSHSRGVFHRDLASDNFIMKGDEFSDIVSQGDKPVVGLLDFGAGVVSRAVYDSADPDLFVAKYEDQWHRGSTHGRRKLKDPFATTCTVLGKMGIGNGTINHHLFDLFSWGKIMWSLLDQRGLKGSVAIRNLIYGVTSTDPTKRFHPSVDLRQHEFMVRQKAKADGVCAGGYLRNEDIPMLISLDEVTGMDEVAGTSDAFQGYAKLLHLSQPAMAAQVVGGGDTASDPRSVVRETTEEVVLPEANDDRPHDRISDQGKYERQASEPAPPLPPVLETYPGGDKRHGDRATRDGTTVPPQLQSFIPTRSNEREGIGAVSTVAPDVGRARENLAAGMRTLADGRGGPALEAEAGATECSRAVAMGVPDARPEAQGARANNRIGISDRAVLGCDTGVHWRPVGDQVQTAMRAATADGVAAVEAPSSLRRQGQDRRRNAISITNSTVPSTFARRTSVLGTLFARMAEIGKTIIAGGAAPVGEAATPRQVQFSEPDNASSNAVGRCDAEADVSQGTKRVRADTVSCEDPAGPKESPELSTIAGRLIKRRRATATTNRGGSNTTDVPRGPTTRKKEESPDGAAGMATGIVLGAAGVGSTGRHVRRGRLGGNGAEPCKNGQRLRAGTWGVCAGGPGHERIGAMDVQMEERGVKMEIAVGEVRAFNAPDNGGQEFTGAPTANCPPC